MVSSVAGDASSNGAEETRELIIHSNGDDGYVEVTNTCTLSKVRQLIIEEFDTEQLPSSSVEFAFKVNNIRLSQKQEARRNAFDLVKKQVKVEIIPRASTSNNDDKKRKVDNNPYLEDNSNCNDKKKSKIETCAVTPFGISSIENKEVGNNGGSNATGGGDISTIGTVDASANSSVARPTNLDKKKFSANDDVRDDDEDLNDLDDNNMETEDNVEGDNRQYREDSSANDINSNDINGPQVDNDGGIDDYDVRSDATDEIVGKFSGQSDSGVGVEASLEQQQSVSNEEAAADDGALKKRASTAPESDDDLFDIEKNTNIEVDDGAASDEFVVEEDPHKETDEAKEKSNQVLKGLTDMLNGNPHFCSETRKNDWLDEINQLTQKSTPQTVFGVLGNTGVGKSSLLNGLLDEAAVLPTSGSRGCTAAVVELVFHSDLLGETNSAVAEKPDTVPAYKGTVEFITLEDWQKELRVLVEECSTQEKYIYAIPPMEDGAPDAYAAWQKIEQVYGKGSMEVYCRKQTEIVYHTLANNTRVRALLQSAESNREYNSIVVDAGEVVPGSDEAKELLKPFNQMKGRLRNKKKKWASEFRSKINTYVYRKGNGNEPQTWPLIRKVTLNGPWNVLSTGAVLVDLPGVRDSNAARAKVAEKYLQNCNQIAIVAPIKRAVDDGTAKELLGEQFKRRLLMDGQYGNVFFICTQTDDLEPTETMRDHSDVAQKVPGRWEKMTELASEISLLERQISDKLHEEEELKDKVEEFKQQYQEAVGDLREFREENDGLDDDDEEEIDADQLENLKAVIATAKSAFRQSTRDLEQWKEDNTEVIERDQEKCDSLQKQLKTMCSIVRNEYSKQCLQEDFRSGLKELYRKDDDDDDGGDAEANVALPEDFNMEVFAISANDYLKIMRIKASRDGPPNCFTKAVDTQIPLLRSFVHKTTAKFCKDSIKSFVEQTNDLVEQMKLLCTDSNSDVSTGSARRMKQLHQNSVQTLSNQVKPIAKDFKKVIDQKVRNSLASSLKTGARKGSENAMTTVVSWGSKSRRTKSERAPDKNGLYFMTYKAVSRRDGVYNSQSAGAVDLNQELCDPMEREFSTEWQSVLDSTIRSLLADGERKILQLSTTACQNFAQSLRQSGVAADRLASMLNTANRSATTALKSSFSEMRKIATDAQRELSRELLPAVKEKMKASYTSVLNATGGKGVFERMKTAMVSNSQHAVNDMFDSAMDKLMKGIQALIKRLESLIESTSNVVGRSLENVFSILWDDKSDKTKLIDPHMQKLIQDCRDALLPEINKLQSIQGNACELLGIEIEEVELDLVGVETLEQQLSRRVAEAKKNGNLLDLCDSDADVSASKKMTRVKSEKGALAVNRSPPKTSATGIIDLCDSDSESDSDDSFEKAMFGTKPKASVRVKTEAWL